MFIFLFDRFWETLAYIANTLIFIIVGMVISEKAIFEIHGLDWFYMFSLYFGVFVVRYSVTIFLININSAMNNKV